MKRLLSIFTVSLFFAVAFAQEPQTFIYKGKEYTGTVLEVVPAKVKILSPNGRTVTVNVDELDVPFAATLDIPNSPYKKLLGTQPQPVAKGAGVAGSPASSRSVPAAKAAATAMSSTIGDVTVEIVSAEAGRVVLKNGQGQSESMFLNDNSIVITLKITNHSETQKVDYTTWRDRYGMHMRTINSGIPESVARDMLKDNLGNAYKQPVSTPGDLFHAAPSQTSIYPGEAITDVLIFEPAVKSATSFSLTLPGNHVGVQDKFALSLPATAIKTEARASTTASATPTRKKLQNTLNLPTRKLGDATVDITSVRIGKIRTEDTISVDRNFLVIEIKVTNSSPSQRHIMRYKSWRGDSSYSPTGAPNTATVRDNFNRPCGTRQYANSAPEGGIREQDLKPGESAADVLVFEQPGDDARYFTLELPGANVGFPRSMKYQIQMDSVMRDAD